MRSSHLLWLSTCLLASATTGCGSSQAQAETPAANGPEATVTEETADSEADAASEADAEQAPAEEAPTADAESAEDSSKPSSRGTAIQKIVKENRQKVRDCYDAALKQSPDLKGNLVIHFKVDAEGKVSAAELVADRSQITDPKVVDCAIAALKSMSFPPHDKGMDTEVNYPFNFNPK